jgi:hypothetical protein
MAATHASKEAVWLQRLCSGIGLVQEDVRIECDSQSAIFLARGVQRPRIFFFGPTYFRRFRADILSPGRHISGTTYFRDHMLLGGFRHMVFADGFLFLVKELGFWTNPGHWVRVLDAAGSYMYIVL